MCGGTWSVRSSMVVWAVELSVREFGGSCLREHEKANECGFLDLLVGLAVGLV